MSSTRSDKKNGTGFLDTLVILTITGGLGFVFMFISGIILNSPEKVSGPIGIALILVYGASILFFMKYNDIIDLGGKR